MKVEGSVAVVTGGASGIGRGVVELLLEQGACVAMLDLERSAGAELAESLGSRARFIPCDVTRQDSVEGAIESAHAEFGRFDVLVSCAGVSRGARVIARDKTLHTRELFVEHLNVNLVGMFDVVRRVAEVMARNEPAEDGERGLIVNVASIAAYEGQVGQVAYAASKGGVVAMTLPLARDLSEHGIRVMCICPGTMDTPMLASLSREFISGLAQKNVFPKRVGRPSDVASVVVHVMENTYFNGEAIRLDAGLRMSER